MDSLEKHRKELIAKDTSKWYDERDLLKNLSLNKYLVDALSLTVSKYSNNYRKIYNSRKVKAKALALAVEDSIFISGRLQKYATNKEQPLIKVIASEPLLGHVYSSVTREAIFNASISNRAWPFDVYTNAKGDFEKWINIHNTDSFVNLEIRAENYLPLSVKIPVGDIKGEHKFALEPKKMGVPPRAQASNSQNGESSLPLTRPVLPAKPIIPLIRLSSTKRVESQNILNLHNVSNDTLSMADINSITDSLNAISITLQSLAKLKTDTAQYALQSTVSTISGDQSFLKGQMFVLIGLVALFMGIFTLLFNRVNTINDNFTKSISDLSSVLAGLKASVDGLGEMKNSLDKVANLQKDVEYLVPLHTKIDKVAEDVKKIGIEVAIMQEKMKK